MRPLWTDGITLPSFQRLEQDIKTEVLIVGGGIAGLLCAYFLQKAGVDYILAEAEQICNKVTEKTTAKITFQHGLIYNDLIRKFGLEKAKMYLNANQDALEKYKELCERIPCDFEEKDAVVYSRNNRKKIEKELTALEQLGYSAEFRDKLPLPVTVAGAIAFPKQAQFHPLKFLSTISKNLHIYEHTPIQEFIGKTADTGKHRISADKIIITTHFPILNKHGSYFIKLYQHRSYVIALENAPAVNGMFLEETENGLSFRNYKNLLLIGGGDHRTGKQGGCYAPLQSTAKQKFPGANEVYRWATQDCMTLDGVPYIGQYSARTPDWYVATGFNKWGMTSSMVAATILTDMICQKNNPYAAVFSPSRSIVHPQLFVNTLEACAGLLTPAKKRCPHLGCALKWNPCEHTWDCSCHGSRFQENGKLIDNPATGNLKEKK